MLFVLLLVEVSLPFYLHYLVKLYFTPRIKGKTAISRPLNLLFLDERYFW